MRKISGQRKVPSESPSENKASVAERPSSQNPETTSATVQSPPSDADLEHARRMLTEVTGVKDLNLAARMLEQVNRIQAPWLFGNISEGFSVAFEFMRELRPTNVTEGMLAQQMVGVHHAALSYLFQAAHGGERSESYLLRATKLMRLFHEQAEVMTKLKGRVGQQKVTVEHVHIHKGAQAIVGAVGSAKQKQGEGVSGESQKKTP